MLHLQSAAACHGSCLGSTCQSHWSRLAWDHTTPVCSQSLVPRLTCSTEQERYQRSSCAVLAPAVPLKRLEMSVTDLMGTSELQQNHSLTDEEQTAFPEHSKKFENISKHRVRNSFLSLPSPSLFQQLQEVS